MKRHEHDLLRTTTAPDRRAPAWATDWVPLDLALPHGMDREHAPPRILVPPDLAVPVNSARKKIRTTDCQDAAVYYAAMLPPPTLDPTTPSGGSSQEKPFGFSPAPSQTVASAASALADRVEGHKAKCRLPGRRVQVVSPAELARQAASIDALVMRKPRDEAKASRDMVRLIQERGPRRTVVLSRKWRVRLERLEAEMPTFREVVEHIRSACELCDFTGAPLRIGPMLMVGLPGAGKSRFAKQLADVIGVPLFFYSLQTAETVSTLTGSDRHWSNSEPGQLLRLIVLGDVANPVVVLDELDKAPGGLSGGSGHYKPARELLGVLEPETATTIRDKSMDLSFDASHTIYIATANRLSSIDSALLSRFKLFHIDEPDARAKVTIARSVAQDVLRQLKLEKMIAPLIGDVLQQMAVLGSPRLQRQVLIAALGRAVADKRSFIKVEDLGSVKVLKPGSPGRITH